MGKRFVDVLAARRSVRAYSGAPVLLSEIEAIVQAALGATDAEGRRAVPSAHGFYPLSVRVVAGAVQDVDAGLYQFEDGLELLDAGDVRQGICEAAVEDQGWIADAACVLTICGDAVAAATIFAEQRPFGERGMRYLYLEAGAAAQTMLLAAADLDLGAVLVAGFDDGKTAEILGLSAPLVPIAHICLGRPAVA